MLLFTCLTLASVVGARAQAADSTRQQLQALQTHIEQVTRQLEAAQGERGKLTAELRRAEEAIAHAATALRDTRKRLAGQRAKLDRLDRRAATEQQAVQGEVDALRAQIIAAYRMGREPAIKLFLNQQGPARLGRMLAYYDYLNQARAADIAQARKALAELIATRRQAAAQRRQLQATLNAQRAKQTALQQAENRRRIALSKLDRIIVSKRTRLANLQENEKRLQKLLSSVRQTVVSDASLNALSQRPFGQLRGRLPWPTAGTLAVRFNTPRSGSGGTLRWQGVFINAPKGQAVHAIDAGRVVFANWLSGYGLLLIIDHGHGYMSLYGHTQAIYRGVGTWVRAGETVASVGDSGGRRTQGLYFAIRHNGAPLDPSRWCGGRP
ncbi:hypothetical protein BW247_00375 [Acidihalobacter ferrooxydans]|uniref:M23ase beta-sheet core domain-containing protein n=1 Tax=Acidihalobacter ferrooxydans TaxID=1765967 RepID=A0A1P8UKW1_9GAMM|nr:hypothetical protein BW247_00375 [Acidihalobacter ferrooxydans]